MPERSGLSLSVCMLVRLSWAFYVLLDLDTAAAVNMTVGSLQTHAVSSGHVQNM